MKSCIIIFAKEPKPGKVKTRLRENLADGELISLYKAFLKDTISIIEDMPCGIKILAYESGGSNPRYLRKIAASFEFYKQKGNNLGLRMHNAFRFAREKGPSKMVIIGSDSPTLSGKLIEEAFVKLDRNDLVLGPSLDGGYYLIGLKEPCRRLFEGIEWSSDKVLADTEARARELNKKVTKLDKWYDVDDPSSFSRLKRDLRKKDITIAPWTRRFLKSKKG